MYLKLKPNNGKIVTSGLIIDINQIVKIDDNFVYDKNVLEEVKVMKNDKNRFVEIYDDVKENDNEIEEKLTTTIEVQGDEKVIVSTVDNSVDEDDEESKPEDKKIYSKEELNNKVRSMGFFGFRKWAKDNYGTTDNKKARLIKEILEIQKRG